MSKEKIINSLKDKRLQAIYNNNGLYEAIFGTHQIEFQQTNLIRYSLEKTPPLYSNLVTISQNWKPDDIFRKIDRNNEKEIWDEWSIKDSFNELDLIEYGFRRLFDAQWIYLEAENFTPLKTDKNLRYEIVADENTLSDWRLVWDSNKELGREIFKPESLNNSKLHYIAGYEGKQIVCGCLVNKTDNVLGISNFFAPVREIEYWSELIEFIFTEIEQTDIVGYERKEFVDKLTSLEFESVGDLTVWLKKRDSAD